MGDICENECVDYAKLIIDAVDAMLLTTYVIAIENANNMIR